jgi:hypothetical protein
LTDEEGRGNYFYEPIWLTGRVHLVFTFVNLFQIGSYATAFCFGMNSGTLASCVADALPNSVFGGCGPKCGTLGRSVVDLDYSGWVSKACVGSLFIGKAFG